MFAWRAFPARGDASPGAYLAVPALERQVAGNRQLLVALGDHGCDLVEKGIEDLVDLGLRQ